MTNEFDYYDLVRDDRLHSWVYTHPVIFEDELQRIFYRWWVFIGHASEVPEPGDYALKMIGRQSIIMVRGDDGALRLLLNRCRHRANAVCQSESGNSNFFRCAYHGWTYRNTGQLTGVPFPQGYADDFSKDQMGLTAVPRVGEYRGFVFGSLSPVGIAFDEFLNDRTRRIIDNFLNASPVGDIDARAGVSKHEYHGNWKFVGMDGYHPAFTHAAVDELMRQRGDEGLRHTWSEKSTARTWDFGNGHTRLDQSSNKPPLDEVSKRLSATSAGKDYLAAMRAEYGDDAESAVQGAEDPHIGIWPNLQIIGVQIRVIHPVAADRTVVHTYPTLLRGVPEEINRERLRRHEFFYGPAGFGTPDDYEMFERNQIGLNCEVDPWLIVSRGQEREVRHEDGSISGNITDEVPQRAQMKQWRYVMTLEDDANDLPREAEAARPVRKNPR